MIVFKNKEGSKPSLFYLGHLLRIFLWMGGLLLLHIFIVEIYCDRILFYSLPKVYLFHTLCAIVVCGVLSFLIGKIYIAYRFVALTFLQMIFCIAFLFPVLYMKERKVDDWDILSFMFAFFVALFLEVCFAISLIKREENQKKVL